MKMDNVKNVINWMDVNNAHQPRKNVQYAKLALFLMNKKVFVLVYLVIINITVNVLNVKH